MPDTVAHSIAPSRQNKFSSFRLLTCTGLTDPLALCKDKKKNNQQKMVTKVTSHQVINQKLKLTGECGPASGCTVPVHVTVVKVQWYIANVTAAMGCFFFGVGWGVALYLFKCFVSSALTQSSHADSTPGDSFTAHIHHTNTTLRTIITF